jgi:hypothetical protein
MFINISLNIFRKSIFRQVIFNQYSNNSNFNVKVKAFPKDVIIQIGKPLFGNLLKIQFNNSTGLSFDPKIDNRYLSLLKKFKKKDYIKFFNSCFNNFNIAEKVFILKKSDVELQCIHQDQDTLLVNFFYENEISFYGVLKHG